MSKRKSISKKTRFEVFKRDNFTCQYCGKMAPDVILEVDHINPVKCGGSNDILNLITSCKDCNRGKGSRKLSDNEMIKKQQEQLKEINEKKNQLELLIKWKKELLDFEDKQVDEIEKILEPTGNIFSDYGRENCKKLIKKYGFEEVYESTIISFKNYYLKGDEESIKKCFNYISRICITRSKQKNNPNLYRINYLIKIAKNNFRYVNEIKLKRFLNYYFKEEDFENLKNIFCSVYNWSELEEELNCYYNIVGDGE